VLRQWTADANIRDHRRVRRADAPGPLRHSAGRPNWAYELKLDGYRALAIKSYGVGHLRSRNNKSFDAKYPVIVAALAHLPDETVIDGEVVALDAEGRPSFSALQNSSATAHLCYYVFDVLVLAGRNVMAEPVVRQARTAARLKGSPAQANAGLYLTQPSGLLRPKPVGSCVNLSPRARLICN
jgi:ATP-dependent DNA ligase